MNDNYSSTGSPTAPAPTIDHVQARLSELISLLEVIDDHAFRVDFRKPDEKAMRNISRMQDLAHLAIQHARYVDQMIEDYAGGVSQ